MIKFFREQTFIATLLLVSFLVIVAGIIMIQYSSKKAEVSAAASQAAHSGDVLATMTNIANIAGQQLQDTQASTAPIVPVGDVIPQESLDRVAALNGRVPDVGSDDWCEVMMVKKASDWSQEEKSLFAHNCL